MVCKERYLLGSCLERRSCIMELGFQDMFKDWDSAMSTFLKLREAMIVRTWFLHLSYRHCLIGGVRLDRILFWMWNAIHVRWKDLACTVIEFLWGVSKSLDRL
jgi:hypothetical protein